MPSGAARSIGTWKICDLWYRQKIRELSGIDADPGSQGGDAVVVPMPAAADSAAVGEQGSDEAVLSMTGEVEPADRKLGDLLHSLELVDSDTLHALLQEARRQRRSLRQLLLAGGYLTLYQMALIETGKLDGLVLGPVRVIDRLPATPREAVYRVFDPRHNREALLRHLAESEMADAVRPDEFRQRFAAAMVEHPHLAATWEILEIAGRPAVLQECPVGLAGNDWPTLAAAPGVWFRLLGQAAQGLRAMHEAGLVHGHLTAESFVCTRDGVVKIIGLGEPRWLVGGASASGEEPTPGDDLLALGQAALVWGRDTPRKSGKPKQLPEALLNWPRDWRPSSRDSASTARRRCSRRWIVSVIRFRPMLRRGIASSSRFVTNPRNRRCGGRRNAGRRAFQSRKRKRRMKVRDHEPSSVAYASGSERQAPGDSSCTLGVLLAGCQDVLTIRELGCFLMDEVAEMNKKYIVRLTPEDRQSLEALVRRGQVAAYKAKRAWILLQADASADGPGWPDEKISEAYGVGLRTIHRVRQTWVEDGLAAVLKRAVQMRRRSRKLDGEQEAHLIALACSQPPAGRCRWTVRLLAQRFIALGHCLAVSPETIRQTLKKTNSSRIW